MNFFKFIIIHEELSSLLGVQTQGLFIEITDYTVLFHIHLVYDVQNSMHYSDRPTCILSQLFHVINSPRDQLILKFLLLLLIELLC